ncbi:MAG: hypothetical protein ACKVYV_08015 [Limisphaerales bacterium]
MDIVIRLGRRYDATHAGWMADFCEVCRDITVHQTLELSHDWRLYRFIRIPGTRVTSEAARCSVCGFMQSLPSMREMLTHHPEELDFDVLDAHAMQRLRRNYRERLALEGQAKAAAIRPDERQRLLDETFTFFAAHGAWSLSWWPLLGGWGLYAAIYAGSIVVGIVFALLTGPGPAENPGAWFMTFSVLFLFIAFAFWIMKALRRQQVSGDVLPWLARSLQTLRPTPGEIRACVERLQRRNDQSGWLINPRVLSRQMAILSSTPPLLARQAVS